MIISVVLHGFLDNLEWLHMVLCMHGYFGMFYMSHGYVRMVSFFYFWYSLMVTRFLCIHVCLLEYLRMVTWDFGYPGMVARVLLVVEVNEAINCMYDFAL